MLRNEKKKSIVNTIKQNEVNNKEHKAIKLETKMGKNQ